MTYPPYERMRQRIRELALRMKGKLSPEEFHEIMWTGQSVYRQGLSLMPNEVMEILDEALGVQEQSND